MEFYLKRVWITHKSLSNFRAYYQVFVFVRNEISTNYHITGTALCFLTYSNSLSQVNFLLLFSIHSLLLYVLFEF